MTENFDLFIIGGGINGAGIARDASGRGLKVCLADKGEIGNATSSWSTKLIHGGLRYLENYEFKLVNESLKEREVIYKIAKEITKPIPFVIPHTKKLRPAWLIKIGLFLYDNLGGNKIIPRSQTIKIDKKYPNILKSNFKKGFQYYDLQVDDKKLTELNIDDAKRYGATIYENNKVIKVVREKYNWNIYLENNKIIKSNILINATGPWVNEIVKDILKTSSNKSIKLIKGSHIITNKLYNQEIAFTLQNDDKRIIFVIPYKQKYSLIGTTEVEVVSPDNPKIEKHEIEYLISSVNKYFSKQISNKDIVETFAGIRPLIEDFNETSKISRDYIFDLDIENNLPPLLNIYGGKLTTYRKLAEKALDELSKFFPKNVGKPWTDKKILK